MSRALVILLSQTRSHESTYENIKKNLIDVLGADLCLCIGVKSDYNYDNPFYQAAKYKFLYHELEDDPNFYQALEYAYRCTQTNTFEVLPGINCAHGKDAISVGKYTKEEAERYLDSTRDLTVDSYVYDGSELFALREKNNTNFVESTQHTTYKRPIPYFDFLHLKHHIFEETESTDQFTNFTISMGIHIFFSWFLLKNLREYGLMDKYDRFIITRSDFVYQLPHPTLDLLNPENIWIPDGQHHHGVCDRHAVLSRNHLAPYLNIMEQFFIRSNDYYREIQNSNKWNMERILKMNLEKNGVADKVSKFPYIMYLIRTSTESSRWTDGIYIEEFGYYIKYPDEYMLSSYYKNAYDNSGLDITVFYHIYGWL